MSQAWGRGAAGTWQVEARGPQYPARHGTARRTQRSGTNFQQSGVEKPCSQTPPPQRCRASPVTTLWPRPGCPQAHLVLSGGRTVVSLELPWLPCPRTRSRCGMKRFLRSCGSQLPRTRFPPPGSPSGFPVSHAQHRPWGQQPRLMRICVRKLRRAKRKHRG